MIRRAAMSAGLLLALMGPPGRARADGPPPATTSSSTAPVVDEMAIELERKRLTDGGRYEEAIPVVERIVAHYDETRGADHLDTLSRVMWLASLQRWTGRWAAAERLHQRVISSLERTGQTGHVLHPRALRSLLETYREKGDLERAQPIAERLVREAEALSSTGETMVQALRELAEVHRGRGAWRSAEPLLLRALSLVESHGTPAVVEVASDRDERGDETGTRAWTSRTRAGEVDILAALARMYLDAGDLGRAKVFADRLVAAYEEMASGGEVTVGLAHALHDLGRVLAARGDAAEALSTYSRSRKIREALLGKDHAGVATVLHSEAILRLARGEAAEAEALARRALVLVEKAYGAEHRRVADVLTDLSDALVSQGRVAEAVPLADRAATIRERDAQVVLSVGSDAQKRALLAGRRKHLDANVSLSALHAPGDRAAARLALRSLLRDKGRLIDAAASELSALRGHLEAEDQALLDELERVTSALAAAAARGEQAAASPEGRERIERLAGERRRLSALIAEHSAEYRAAAGLVTVEEVAAAVPDDAALVEVTAYRPFLLPAAKTPPRPGVTAVPWGEARYAAYVLRRGEVAVVDLGPASAVDAAVERLRAALADPDLSRDPRSAAREAFQRVFAPIAPHVGDARHVLWSPDGALQLVPLGALLGEDGRYVVERRLVTYLGSGRDLLRFGARAATRQGPLLIAAPDFGALPGAPAAEAPLRSVARSAEGIDMGRIGFPPLPSTAREIDAIHRALGRGAILTGEHATESAVKRARAPGVLHIATHGFFLPGSRDATAAWSDGLDATFAETAAALSRESPLVRSGIALAGANLRASGPDDGILTALEAATLDLAGTELVVLSACETGLGAAVPGDGVHGLRRAFTIAGAETLVMSLWQVDSGRTRELMTAYYAGLREGRGRSDAMRRAQLAMLGREGTAHPNVWASFIVSGSWGPLRTRLIAVPRKVDPGARGCSCTTAGEDVTSAGWLALIAAALAAGARRLSPRRHTSRGCRGRRGDRAARSRIHRRARRSAGTSRRSARVSRLFRP